MREGEGRGGREEMNKSVHAVSDIFFQKLFSSLDIFNLRCNIFLIKEGFIYLSSYIYIYIFLPVPTDLHRCNAPSFFRSKISNI